MPNDHESAVPGDRAGHGQPEVAGVLHLNLSAIAAGEAERYRRVFGHRALHPREQIKLRDHVLVAFTG